MIHSFLRAILLTAGALWMHIRCPQKTERESTLQVKYQGSHEKVGKRVMVVVLILIFIGELLIEI